MKWILVFMAIAITWNNFAFGYDFCNNNEKSIAHVPRADVAHGTTQITIPDPIYIPLTVDMAQRYDLNVPAGVELESTLGMIEIYKNGKILYDGKDISGDIKDDCDAFNQVIEKQMPKPKPLEE